MQVTAKHVYVNYTHLMLTRRDINYRHLMLTFAYSVTYRHFKLTIVFNIQVLDADTNTHHCRHLMLTYE